MKILYHHRTRSKDGQSVHIDEMIAALRNLGHEVIVVAPAGDASQMFGSDDKALVLLKHHVPKFFYELMELGYNLIAFRDLARAVRVHQPDCIYERYNLFLLAGIWIKRRHRLPLLLEINSPIFEERELYNGLSLKRLAHWAQTFVWNAADRVLPVTQVMADIVHDYGVDRNKITVIHNGINQDDFNQSISANSIRNTLGLQDRLVLGFTGFIREWHGLNKVIDMLAGESADSKLHLLVVGDGPERINLENQARLLQVEDRVSFTGMIKRNRIPEFVQAFDIALQPAVVAYASPLKLIEYLAMGKAIIAPAQPNICELLTDEHNALLFDPDQPDELPKVINRLCNDPALIERLSNSARLTITDRQLTWRENARKVEQLIEGVQQRA